MPESLLIAEQICKSFGETPVLRDVSFRVAQGEVVCLLGPSGCGKTTLLYIIAGLEQADSGRVLVEGADISTMPVHRRGFGLMFQDWALFPHKNVYDNVAFGLRMAGLPQAQIEARVRAVLEMVGLSQFKGRDVNQLSGGEQQRVALARSLAPRPRLLMLDEPLGSLDRALRERLMNELRDILKQVGQTSLYVTHDQHEAFAIADRVIIMGGGRVLQEGTPIQVYRHPACAEVAQFLGMNNLLLGHVLDTVRGEVQVKTPLGKLGFKLEQQCQIGENVIVLIRPEAATVIPDVGQDCLNELAGTLVSTSFRGDHQLVVVQANQGVRLSFTMEATVSLPSPGQRICLHFESEALMCFPVKQR